MQSKDKIQILGLWREGKGLMLELKHTHTRERLLLLIVELLVKVGSEVRKKQAFSWIL